MSEMTTPRRRFTRVKGLAMQKRLPRIGKIRLGRKVAAKRGGAERPVNLDFFYFVEPPEDATEMQVEYYRRVLEHYGDAPKQLPIMLPCESMDQVFPTSYSMYGANNRIKCHGDGEEAERFLCESCGQMACRCESTGIRSEMRKCPCEELERRQCRLVGRLMVVLYEIALDGVWQIDTGSINSIVDLTSALDDTPDSPGYLRTMLGRISMVPLVLRREPRITMHQGQRAVHATLKIAFGGTMTELKEVRTGLARPALPEPSRMMDESRPESPHLDGDALPADAASAREEESAEQCLTSDNDDLAAPEVTPEQKLRIVDLRRQTEMRSAEKFTAWLRERKLPQCASLTEPEADRIIDALQEELVGG